MLLSKKAKIILWLNIFLKDVLMMDVKAILSQMTLEEKAAMCSGHDFWTIEKIDRLGVPRVLVTDGPCGLRKQEGEADHLGINGSVTAISFPTGSCVASSFDRELIKKSGEVLGEECQAENVAVLLGPAVNIKRSPLCGRNFEYFSEDPYLSGEMAVAYINGVQSQNVGTSIKHFAANSQEHRRMTSDSIVDERTLREIYLPAFEIAVKDSKPWTVMCSYNKVNGTFASDNHRLLTEVLRDEWGFDGLVVSDWGAVNDRVEGVVAGMDLEMPGKSADNDKAVLEAVKSGRITEAQLDIVVERILTLIDKYESQKKEGVKFDYERDHQFARELAANSMVLLKNDNLLPLAKDKRVAFIGEFAEKPRYQGGGSSHVNTYKVSNSLDTAEGIDMVYAKGFNAEESTTDDNLIGEAVAAAKSAEAAVLFVGIPNSMESEGFDRSHLRIPECQEKLIEEVAKAQPNTIVVVECGGAIEMPWLESVKAVLYAYLGGEAVGAAINDIIFGDVNPASKLAETFPLRLEDNPSYLFYVGEGDRVEYREGVFVGYRYYDKKKLDVLFPFGFGLSYTSFEYSDLQLDKKEMQESDSLKVSVKVKNTGSRAGKEIVQLYVGDNESTVLRPVKELKGFDRISLEAGEEKTVEFTLDKRAFAYYDTDISDWYVESGEFTIMIGKSSRDIVLEDVVVVTNPSPKRMTFNMNSTLGDVMKDPRGGQIVGQMMAEMSNSGEINMDAATEILGSAEAMAQMVANVPLRALVSMGGGKVTQEQMEGLVALLNS